MAGLWLLRHGALPPNPERRFVGARDIVLTDAGREQIRRAARALLADCRTEGGLPTLVTSATGQGGLAEGAIAGSPEKGAPAEGNIGRSGPCLPQHIICSDLERCRESARLVQEVFRARGHAIDIVPDAGLREISLGLWEGLTVAEVEARWPGGHAARGAERALPPCRPAPWPVWPAGRPVILATVCCWSATRACCAPCCATGWPCRWPQ